MSSQNILQLSKYYPPILGGIELVAKMLTKAHSKIGDKVFIVAFKNEQTFESLGEFGEQVEWINADLELKSALFNWSFIFKFRKYLVSNNIQKIYVHLPNPYMHELVRLNRRFLEKRKIVVSAIYHSDIVNQKILRIFYNFYFVHTSSIYKNIIVSSEKLWKSSSVLTQLPVEKMKVIPFCSEGNMSFKQRSNFGGKLLAIGRMVPYKGFEFLINAINESNYELHIIGDGPLYQNLKLIASKNIILHKKLNEIDKNALIAKSDLLIVSSINSSEAYGMIIVEAFESGLPVVASNLNSGVTFLVQNNVTGRVFETLNKESLLSEIRYFQDNSVQYQKVSKNVRDFYEKELSFDCFKERVRNL
jgi:rhamnosyl/mannosyltransferase